MKIIACFCCALVLVQVYCHPVSETDKKIKFIPEKDQEKYSSVKIDDFSKAQPANLHSVKTKIGSALTCYLCKKSMDLALWTFRTPDRKYTGLFKFATNLCTHLHIETTDVCTGMINAMKNETQYLLAKVDVTGEMVCGLIFPSMCKSNDLSWNKEKWYVSVPKPLPNMPKLASKHMPRKTLKVLQVSDIHVDLLYKPGSQVDCTDPLCCRTPASKGERHAGKWGSLGYCDIPYHTVENFLLEASKEKFDYVLWTGDLPAHDDWNQSRENQLFLLSNITALFLKYFPDTPIYPALGNHESFPVNSFPPSYVSDYNEINWLYEALAKWWSPWLPKDALETVRASGFYTLLVQPGLRLISLNMNYCNNENFWMLYDPVDPNGELKWLVDTLAKAEKNGEKVHIIGHIPPTSGGDCLEIWRNNYFSIITRFQHTVIAQFFGHTHYDQIEIIYENSSLNQPVSVAYISPSLTTYPNLNPGYRVYDMDSQTWDVIDHRTYILHLSKANQENRVPTWELEYSAKQAYNLSSLSVTNWSNLYKTWMDNKNESLFQKYFSYYYKNSPPSATCAGKCWEALMCSVVAGNFTQPSCA